MSIGVNEEKLAAALIQRLMENVPELRENGRKLLQDAAEALRDGTEVEIRITLKKKGNSNGNPQP